MENGDSPPMPEVSPATLFSDTTSVPSPSSSPNQSPTTHSLIHSMSSLKIPQPSKEPASEGSPISSDINLDHINKSRHPTGHPKTTLGIQTPSEPVVTSPNGNSNSNDVPPTTIDKVTVTQADIKNDHIPSEDGSSSYSQPSFEDIKVFIPSDEKWSSDASSDEQKDPLDQKHFRNNATLGNKSFLNNVNYVTHNNHYLNERFYHSLSPRHFDNIYKDYVSLSPDIIPGYTLQRQFSSTFEKADLLYQAIKDDESHKFQGVPQARSSTDLEHLLDDNPTFNNEVEIPPGSKVVIRLSPNILKSVPLSRFLNEWYILSGLNIPNQHRLFGNKAISNDYFSAERSSKLDFGRYDIYKPVTLPRDLKGVWYPVKVLTINMHEGLDEPHSDADFVEEPNIDLLDGINASMSRNNSIHSGQSDDTNHSNSFFPSPKTEPYEQCRLALVYIDNNYRTLKDIAEENSVNLSEDRTGSVKSGGSIYSTSSSANGIPNMGSVNGFSTNGFSFAQSNGISGFAPSTGLNSSITGNSLFDEISNKIKQAPKSPLKVIEVISDILRVLDSLAVVHEFGVVHNGITSSSIVKSDNDNTDVKLTGWDFCFTIQPEESSFYYRKKHLTQIPELLPYLSPEICSESNKGVDYRSDFYAVGIVLYELLVGCAPFLSDNPSKLIRRQILQKPIAPSLIAHAWINDELSDIIMKLLEKDPNDRYLDCHSLINDLIRVKNQYICNVTDLGDSVIKYWSKRDDYKFYLKRENYRNLDKCGVAPHFSYPRGVYGRRDEYKKVFTAYENFTTGVNLLFITGESGSGKTTLMNDLRSSAISTSDYFFHWKFNSNETSVSIYTCFLHGIKVIIGQIMSSSPENISKWRDLIIAKIPLDLSILFFVVPEMKAFLGPTYSTLIGSDGQASSSSEDRNVNLDSKFRYIIKAFYCLIGFQGLTMFLDDIQYCSINEWAMISEILEYFQSNDLEKDVSVKLVAGYSSDARDTLVAGGTIDHVIKKEDLLNFLKDSKVNNFEFELKRLNESGFADYITAGFVSSREGSAVRKEEQTSLSSMLGHSTYSINYMDEAIKETARNLFAITEGSILLARYLIGSASLNGLIHFEENNSSKEKNWVLDLTKLETTSRGRIVKSFLSSALNDKAKSLMKFAAIAADGYYFHLSQLMIVTNLSIREVYQLLHLCVETGVITPTSNNYKIPFHLMTSADFPFELTDSSIWELATQTRYRFIHDSLKNELIRELVERNELQEFHRLCGLRYYKRISKQTEFSISNYLQMAHHLSSSCDAAKPEDYSVYESVLIQAGRYAASTYNSTASLKFFQSADLFIDIEDSKTKLKSVLTICQTQYFLKRYEECLAYIDEVQTKYNFDETAFLLARVRCLVQSGKFEQGLKTAVKGLQRVGIEVYLNSHRSELLYNKVIDKVPISIPEIRQLKDLQKATNPVVLLIYELISDIIVPSYLTGNDYLGKYLVAQLVLLMHSYGTSPFCAIPLIEFANSFAKMNDKANLLKAVELCKVALDMVNSTENTSSDLINNVYEYYITSMAAFVEPIPNVLKYFDVFIRSIRPFDTSSTNSLKVVPEASKYILTELNGYPFDSTLSGNDEKKLDFNTSSRSFEGPNVAGRVLMQGDMTLDEYDETYLSINKYPNEQRFYYYVCKIRFLNLSSEYNQVKDLILQEVNEISEYLPLGLTHISYHLACAIALSNCEFKNEDEAKSALVILQKAYDSYQLWSELCPTTFRAKFLCIQALWNKRRDISSLVILDQYDLAIEVARENNNWYDVGKSSYLCAVWLSREGHANKRVVQYAKAALEVFRSLDDRALAGLIEKQFGMFLEDGFSWAGLKHSDKLVKQVRYHNGQEEKPLSNALRSFFTSEPGRKSRQSKKAAAQSDVQQSDKESGRVKNRETHHRFSGDDHSTDLNKAVKACLSISESSTDITIVLKLLESTIMFSDVDYGIVVIKSNGEPFIQAIGSANTVYSVENQPLSSRADICPLSLLMHVLHTGEIVNKDEDHVMFSNRFGKDDYYQHSHCSAMICVPLKNQSGVFGALYLENQKNIPTGMPFFNARKRDLLALLCTQAAVSLSKAKLYSQMEFAKKAAEDATAEKASFLANMSHEIRTPFNSLLSCSIFLLDTKLTKSQREYVETIKSSAMVTLNIIDGILAFSKIEHGSFTLDSSPFSLCECIESSMQLSGEQAAKNDLELVFLNRCQNFKSVIGDVTRFRQIIINLVGNAIKFTSEGSIVLEASSRKINSDRYEIAIRVKDSGIGIPEESKNKVFGAFSQVDGSSKREFGGAGLGLAISKKLSDIMGGDLGFTSEEGVGSVFHFIVTCQVEVEEKPEVLFDAECAKKLRLRNQALIVDQLKNSSLSLKESLEYFGMEVVTLSNLGEIRQNIDEFAFIFIHESQFASLKKYRSIISDRCKIVITASFGKSLPADMEDHSVLLSPFQRSKLVKIIKSLIDGSPEEGETTAIKSLLAEKYPLKILLAEDNFVNTKVALKHLQKFGYIADHAKDGVEVLTMCEKQLENSEYYDVILMDIQMPRKDGIQATIELKDLFTAKGLEDHLPKIVALTANVAGDDREKSLQCGMVDFISKPVIPGELERVLESLAKAK